MSFKITAESDLWESRGTFTLGPQTLFLVENVIFPQKKSFCKIPQMDKNSRFHPLCNSSKTMKPVNIPATTSYDTPLEDWLDDSGDDLENEAEMLIWIKDFLQQELGKVGGNIPILLMNNIRSLGSDDMVMQVINSNILKNIYKIVLYGPKC
jgi:hypothetical protein